MQWSKSLAAMCLGMSLLCVQGESRTGTVSGEAPDAVVHFSNKTDSSYSIHAQTAGSWVFTDDFSWSGPNGWYSDAKYSIACERITLIDTAFVDLSLCFGASMNGKMYIPGGEGGSPIPWSVSSARHTAPRPYIYPAEAVFAKGAPGELRYVVDSVFTNAPGGFWRYYGAPTAPGGNPYSDWQNAGATYTLPTTLEAGPYVVTAARNTAGAFSASASVTLVGVKQVSATSGSTTVTSTTDSPGDEETLLVAKGSGVITLVATPEPSSAWPSGLPTWAGGATSGSGNVASATLPTTTAGEKIITVTCGTSSKKIKVVVIEIASISRDKTNTSRKGDAGAPSFDSSHGINTFTVATNPMGYEEYVDLMIPDEKGSIERDETDPALWIYEAPVEGKTFIDVPGSEKIIVSSEILGNSSSVTDVINLSSIFRYFGINNKDREFAWRYARWKYDISTSNLSSISYDDSQTKYAGWTVTRTDAMTLGPPAYTDGEWACASVLGHENVHGAQSRGDRILNTAKCECEAYEWEFYHSNVNSLHRRPPITYIFQYARTYYIDIKSSYANHGGTIAFP